MARIARSYGIEFDKDHPVHGGRHDTFFVGSHSVEVPCHPRSSSTPPVGS
jgi:hypothetical protein